MDDELVIVESPGAESRDTEQLESEISSSALSNSGISLEIDNEVYAEESYSVEPIDDIEEEIVSEISGELENIHAVLDLEEADVKAEQSAELEVDNSFVASGKSTTAGGINVEPVVETLEVLKPGSDPDILEIYLEEAEEESENIARLQQDWLLHPEDQNALKNIRRAFHTIKGSGRLVGAVKIGELAWDYEQLLNRVIDKTIAPADAIIDAVGKAAIASRELVEELKNGQPPTSDIAYLRGLARALAAFNADQVLIERTGVMQAI